MGKVSPSITTISSTVTLPGVRCATRLLLESRQIKTKTNKIGILIDKIYDDKVTQNRAFLICCLLLTL
jgi:hypothetical protein